MLMTTILICLVAAFGYLNSFFGSGNIGRPLVMSTLTGLVLGDMQLGIMTGATLELVWLGNSWNLLRNLIRCRPCICSSSGSSDCYTGSKTC